MINLSENVNDKTKVQQPFQQPTQQPAQQLTQTEPSKIVKLDNEVKPIAQIEKVNHIHNNVVKETDRDDLGETIHQLEEQLKIFMKAQKFIEAEELKNKIKELRLEVVVRKSKEIEHRHSEELERVVNTHSSEIERFNQTWEAKINSFKQEVQAAEKEMISKHEKDLGALEADLKESLPVFVRTSPQILNIRKMIETLAKQKEFVQADKLRLQLASLEEEELRKSEEQKEKKLSFILLQLVTKQKSEFNGLRKRITTAYSELVKAKESEYQKLLCKLHNLRRALDTAQQLEFSKFEMTYKNFVPGERLQFKSRQRRESSATVPRNRAPQNTSLNASFADDSKTTSPISTVDTRKRSATPVKRGIHIRGHTSNNIVNRQSNLIPINNVRFGSAQRERKIDFGLKGN